MESVLVIYHSADFDGKCSAAIAVGAFEDATLYGWDHYQSIDWDLINSHNLVVMVDISFPEEDMIRLNNGGDFIWIDHHQEAIAKFGSLNIPGIQKVGKGACQLCWEYFFPHLDIPRPVKLLADYDVWHHEDKDTLPFQYGMRYVNVQANDSEIWKVLFNEESECKDPFDCSKFYEILMVGETCFNFEKTSNEYKASRAFEVEFQGYKCIALNSSPTSSLVFETVNGSDYDIQIVFSYCNDRWKVTMYQDNGRVDVGEIATYFGGGGHREASGFECTTQQIIALGLVSYDEED